VHTHKYTHTRGRRQTCVPPTPASTLAGHDDDLGLLLRHLGHLLEEELLQGLCHQDDVISGLQGETNRRWSQSHGDKQTLVTESWRQTDVGHRVMETNRRWSQSHGERQRLRRRRRRYLVVNVAVCEHGGEVVDTFLGVAVVMVLQPLLDGSHVHGVLDNIVVILQEVGGRAFLYIGVMT